MAMRRTYNSIRRWPPEASDMYIKPSKAVQTQQAKPQTGGNENMNDNVDIFISTYKDFKTKPTNKVYKIISGGEEPITNTSLPVYVDDGPLCNLAYNEYSRLYWIWKNYPLKDYIGLNHYRKYYTFFDNVPNIPEIFKDHDIVLANRIKVSSGLRKQYKFCHNIEDFECALGIVKELYPEYADIVDEVDKIRDIDACSMFIMKKEDFNKYCEWIFNVLGEFDKRNGLSDKDSYIKRVNDNKSKYVKRTYPGNTVGYQARIDGYLAERLFTIYVRKNFKKPMFFGRKITEGKYLSKKK